LRLATEVERLKLCRLLGLDAAGLGFLGRLPPRAIRQLRQTLWAQRQRQDFLHLRPWLGLARWLPVSLAAWCCERLLGLPLVTALAGELSLQQTLGIARLLSPARLADVCAQLDPRAAHDLVHLLPEARVLAVSRELLARRDHLTLGRFANHLGDAAMQAVLGVIEHDENLLHTVYFIESRSRLDHILRLLPEDRRHRLMQLLLSAEPEQLRQLMFLLGSVSPALQAELGALAATDAAVLARLLQLTADGDYWEDMLPLLFNMGTAAQALLVSLPVWREQPALLKKMLEVADREQLWLQLLPLCGLMDADLRQRSAGLIASMPGAIEHASHAALVGELWDAWLGLLALMPEPGRQDFATLLRRYGELDEGLQQRVLRQTQALLPDQGL
jgi:hypothetical protein